MEISGFKYGLKGKRKTQKAAGGHQALKTSLISPSPVVPY